MEGKPGGGDEEQKLYIASICGPKVRQNEDISNADLEENFGRYGEVVGVFQEREMDGGMKKGSGYIEFSDEDPMHWAVMVGVHKVQTAVLKVESGLRWWQQEEVRIKRQQQKQAGPHKQGTLGEQPPKGPKSALKGEQGPPGEGAFKSKSVPEKNTQSA